ncbi:hypothetical protein H4S07_005074 [Coemansia furcata]|uniref:Uncharacterized protein n=1 Tax=Coemansia furcata TaxID=417177 RepID=A0ACC1L5L4_9FUNG|nr:hypothetical protein H4S07_005074 [Coemansia furcata]
MFPKPLLSSGLVDEFLKDNSYCVVFLPPAEPEKYGDFKKATDDLILILLERTSPNYVPYNAVGWELVKAFKEKKEILIEKPCIAFFVKGETTIVMEGFDHVKFEDNLKKFRDPAPTKSSGSGTYDAPNYDCSCCVIL